MGPRLAPVAIFLLLLGASIVRAGQETTATPTGPHKASTATRARPRWNEASVWQTIEIPGGAGGIVVLRTKTEPQRLIPIFIGFAEYLSISTRLQGAAFARPLTHDLLGQLVSELGGRVIKVLIEKVRPLDQQDGGTFFARVFVRKGKRVFDLDARASDSIAIALGAKAPIFISGSVVDAAGRDAKQFNLGEDTEPQRKNARPPSDPL